MMNQKTCECCGQRIRKLNPHRMDKKKVALLELLAKHGDWMEVKAGRITGFNGDEQVFAMRLGWFGLAEHGAQRSGMYRATPAGISFLLGLLNVPRIIWCRDGQVFDKSDDMVDVYSVRHVVLDKKYWDDYSIGIRY